MLRNNAKELMPQIRSLAQNYTVIMYRKGYSPPEISVFALKFILTLQVASKIF